MKKNFPDEYKRFGGSDHKFGTLEYAISYVCDKFVTCDCLDHIALEVGGNGGKLKVGTNPTPKVGPKEEGEEGFAKEIRCFTCKTAGPKDKKMPSCGGCKSEHFCSRECQKFGWKLHKKRCQKIQKNLAK